MVSSADHQVHLSQQDLRDLFLCLNCSQLTGGCRASQVLPDDTDGFICRTLWCHRLPIIPFAARSCFNALLPARFVPWQQDHRGGFSRTETTR